MGIYSMKLLFITQTIDEGHDDLAFTIQWIDAFIERGYDVQVVCLERGAFDDHFPVYSLGKENGNNKFICAMKFILFILKNLWLHVKNYFDVLFIG